MGHLLLNWYRVVDRLFPSRYPFEMPEASNPESLQSLPELVQEPFGTIKGHTISVWFYREGQNIVEVIEAGHSNSAICSRVTSLFLETLLDLQNAETELFTAGSLWIRIKDKDNKNQELLRSLESHLRDLENKTGLVKVIRFSSSELGSFRQSIQSLNQSYLNAKTLFTDSKIGISSTNPGIFYYTEFPNSKLKENISFRIKRNVFTNQTYIKLSELHDASLRRFRIRDVINRAETYGKWLLQDIFELIKLVDARKKMPLDLWRSNIIPYSGIRDYYIAESSKGKGDLDPLFRRVQNLYQKWYSQFSTDPNEATLTAGLLLEATGEWEKAVAQIKKMLDYGTTSHASRFENTAPHFILEDIRWLIRMIRILILESGDEQSALNRIQELFQPILDSYLIPHYIRNQFSRAFRAKDIDSLWNELEAVTGNFLKTAKELPLQLKNNVSTIFKDLVDIKKDMTGRHKRMDFNKSVNEWILVDALLRGWPSFFLNTKELRDIYDLWVKEVREKMWREIRIQLRARKIIMLPFVEDNISFKVSSNEEEIHVTPYFGINSQLHASIYHKKIGTAHFIMPWKYRKCTDRSLKGSNLLEVNLLLSDCWAAVSRLNLDEAIGKFALALNLHPIRACSAFFAKLWSHLGNIADPKIESSALLQKGLKLLESEETYKDGLRTLEKFIADFSDELVDPYIFLACGSNYHKIMELQKARENVYSEFKEYFQELDKVTEKSQVAKMVTSQGQLNPQIAQVISTIKQSNKLFDTLYLDRIRKETHGKTAIEILGVAEEIIGDLDFAANPTSAMHKIVMLDILRSEFKKAMDSDSERYKLKVESLNNQIKSTSEKLWADLPSSTFYQRAFQLDSSHAQDVLTRKTLSRSAKFQLEYEPYFDLNIADSKMRIGMNLWSWTSELKEVDIKVATPIATRLAEKLKIIQREPLGTSEDDKEKVKRLTEAKLQRLSENPQKEDSIVRLDLLSEAESLSSSFISNAASLYEKSHSMLPSFTPAYVKSMELRCMLFPLYRETIQRLTKSTPPLEVILPRVAIQHDTQVHGRVDIHRIDIEANKRIVAYSENNDRLASIEFFCEDESIINHVRVSVQNPAFRRSLFPLSTSLAKRILKTQVSPTPQTKVLLDLLEATIGPLTFILAYMSARMSPPLSETAFGSIASKELLSNFRDDVLYTEKQQKNVEEYLRKYDNAQPVVKIDIAVQSMLNEILNKKGYKSQIA